MNNYETLIAEYENEVTVEEYDMRTEGFYFDEHILIKNGLSTIRKTCILAEEIGHHFTSVGDILDQNDIDNQKQEHKARVWAYQKLLPLENVHLVAMQGYTEPWQMAEYFDLDEEFVRAALKYYGLLDV